MPVRGSGAREHPLQLLLLKLLRSEHLSLLWPPLFGASLLLFPFLFTHLCSVSLRQSLALEYHAGKLLVFCAPCPQQHLLHPVYPLSCSVSGSPPPHPGDSRSQQFPAHPFPRSWQCSCRVFPSRFRDPRDLSSAVPGLCSSLIWCSHDCAAALSGPALSMHHGLPHVETELQPLALLPSRSSAQSKGHAGWTAAGRALPSVSIPGELHWQGSHGQEEFFWALFLPILMPKMGGLQQ